MTDTIALLLDVFLKSTGICTDTRTLKEGNLFLALKGPNFNGNRFARQALEQGALLVVVDEDPGFYDNRLVVVQDGLETLQALANAYRNTFQIPVVGITGSNGKTTTKELCSAVLKCKYKTFATKGNLNNHIGVPLSLLSMERDTEMALIEMGANHLEELALLCRIAAPSHGLITNVGMDHLEGYGSVEAVAEGNAEMYAYLAENQGIALVNAQDKLLMQKSSVVKNRILYNTIDQNLASSSTSNVFYTFQGTDHQMYTTQLIGQYNQANVQVALSLASLFQVPSDQALEAICSYKPSNNRSQWVKTEHNQIISDAYNANPSSVEQALISFQQMPKSASAVFLGDMFELGDFTFEGHRLVLERLASMTPTVGFLCGISFYEHFEDYPQFMFFEQKAELMSYLEQNPLHDHVVLIKGSRGMAMEEIIKLL